MKRCAVWGAGIALVLGGLMAVGYALRGAVISPLVERLLVREVQDRLGVTITVAGIGGSYLADLEITGIATVEGSAAGAVTDLAVSRIAARYSLPALLFGIDAFLARTEIELDGARLVVDLDRGGPASARTGGAPVVLPAVLPGLRTRDVSLEVRGHGGRVEANGVALGVGTDGEGRVSFRVAELAWAYPGLREGRTSLAAELTYSRETLVLEALSLGDVQVVERARLALAGPPTLGARLRAWGGAIGLTGRVDRDTIRADLQVDGVALAPLSALTEGPPLGGNLAAQVQLRVDPNRPLDLTGDLTATVSDLVFREARVDRVDLHAIAADGTLHFDRVDLSSGDNAARLAASAPLAVLVAGEASPIVEAAEGSFSVSLADVPAVLGMAGIAAAAPGHRVPPHRLVAEGEVSGGTVRLAKAVLETAGVTLALEGGEARWPGGDVPMTEVPVKAHLRIAAADLAPLGALLSLPPLHGSLHGEGEVAGTLAAPRGDLQLDGRNLSLGGVPIDTLTLRATAEGRRLAVDALEARHDEDRVSGAGVVDLATGRIDDTGLSVTVHEVEPYLGPWLPREWPVHGALEGSVTLAGEITSPEATMVLDGHHLSLGGRPLGEATLSGRSTGARLVVDAAEIHRGEDRFVASGTVDLGARHLEGVAVDAAVADVGPDLAGLFPQGREVDGGVTLALHATGPFAAPEGSLVATLRDGRVGDLAIPEARLRARASAGQVIVESLAAHTDQGDVAASGTVIPRPDDAAVAVVLDALTVSREGTALALTEPARLTLRRGGPYAVDRLTLRGAVGGVELAGVLSPEGESDLTLVLHELDSDGWLDALVGERVTFSGLEATLHAAGTPAAPRLAAVGRVRRFAGAGTAVPFTGAFDLAYGEGRLRVNRFDWSAGNGQRLAVTASLPVDPTVAGWLSPGGVTLDAAIDLPDLRWLGDLLPPELRRDGSMRATATVTGTWDRPVGRLDVAADGVPVPKALRPAPSGPYAVVVAASVDGHDLSLEDLRVESPAAHLTAAGHWWDLPSLRRLFAQGEDRSLTGTVHLDGAFGLSDLGWAAARVDGVRRIAGAIEGEVTVDGPVHAPQATARLEVEDGEVRPDADLPAVRAIRATAEVTPGEVRIVEASGEVGGAPFRLTGIVARPTAGRPVVDVTLAGENLLLFRSEGVKVRADADLQVSGPVAQLAVAGELAITDGRLVKNIDLLTAVPGWGRPKASHRVQLFSIPEPPLRDATLDVRVTTSKPFEIKSNIARGTVRPELSLRGTGEIPVVEGEVYVDPLRIALPAGILRVESGVVRFLADDPDRPRVDLVGRARMLGYDISAVVEGPYDEPVVTLSSVPPLLEEELLLLLLTGHPPKTGASQAATNAAGMNVAVYVGRGLLTRLFAGQSVESDESVLDRFEVEIGRGVTRAGQETIDAQFRLAEDVLRDGDVLYITTEKDVYDDVNAGLKIVFRFK